MRILTVRQPWAWAIIHGEKDVENRVRNVAGAYRGPVAIHAAAGVGTYAAFMAAWATVERISDQRFWQEADIRGQIIGVVDLVGVHLSESEGCGTGEGFGGPIPLCSRWAEPWATHLSIACPRALREPIPFTGALGLRRLDDATVSRIEAAIA